LRSREEQGDQDENDRQNDEQFDKGETALLQHDHAPAQACPNCPLQSASKIIALALQPGKHEYSPATCRTAAADP
jgi:hypothetical protein